MTVYLKASVTCGDLEEGEEFPQKCEQITRSIVRVNWDAKGGLPQGDLRLAFIRDVMVSYWIVTNYDTSREVVWGVGDTAFDAILRALYNMTKGVSDSNEIAEITKKFMELYEKYMQG